MQSILVVVEFMVIVVDMSDDIVLPVASCGIALLLTGGLHYRFSISLQVDETTTCSRITPDRDLTKLL